jgi:hypothetical protein
VKDSFFLFRVLQKKILLARLLLFLWHEKAAVDTRHAAGNFATGDRPQGTP